MNLRRFALAALAVPFTLLVSPAADAAGSTKDRVPSPSSHPLVPAVVVFAAIGATVVRMNRRGGPR